jgi:hypothetical protein
MLKQMGHSRKDQVDAASANEILAQIASLKIQSSASYWPAVITGIFTLLASLGAGHFLEHQKHKRLRAAVKTALIAEIKALKKVAIARKYLNLLTTSIDSATSVEILIPENYNPVYRSNVEHIGLLSEYDAQRIVTFHQYVQSVIQDVGPNGALSQKWASSESFRETRDLLKEAFNIADEL